MGRRKKDEFEIPDTLAPFAALVKNRPVDESRWITSVMYTQIQCLVMQRKYQARVDRAQQDGGRDRKAEEQLRRLMEAQTIDQQEYWLQDQAGRAMLTCNVCGKYDVPAVLEMKKDGHRVRICQSCLNRKGMLVEPPGSQNTVAELAMPLPVEEPSSEGQ